MLWPGFGQKVLVVEERVMVMIIYGSQLNRALKYTADTRHFMHNTIVSLSGWQGAQTCH